MAHTCITLVSLNASFQSYFQVLSNGALFTDDIKIRNNKKGRISRFRKKQTPTKNRYISFFVCIFMQMQIDRTKRVRNWLKMYAFICFRIKFNFTITSLRQFLYLYLNVMPEIIAHGAATTKLGAQGPFAKGWFFHSD